MHYVLSFSFGCGEEDSSEYIYWRPQISWMDCHTFSYFSVRWAVHLTSSNVLSSIVKVSLRYLFKVTTFILVVVSTAIDQSITELYIVVMNEYHSVFLAHCNVKLLPPVSKFSLVILLPNGCCWWHFHKKYGLIEVLSWCTFPFLYHGVWSW